MNPLELEIYLPTPDHNFEENWKKELSKYGLSIEYHPDFDIEEQSGFMQLKLKAEKGNKYISLSQYENCELTTGFEFDIEDFDSLEYLTFLEDEGEEITPEYNALISDCDFRITIYAEVEENSSAFRLAYFATAALVELYKGVMINTESGAEFLRGEAVKEALEKTVAFELALKEEEWKLPAFEKWEERK